VLEWWDNSEEDTAVPFYQYLLLNGRDLGVTGLNFHGYGRYANDLANEADVASRLYYAYLEKKNLANLVDLKGGRQFIATSAATTLTDALDVKVHDIGFFSFELYGGTEVKRHESYETGGLLWGAEVAANPTEGADLALSYFQQWRHGELLRELIGLDGRYDYRSLADLYGEVQFNYLANSVSYALAGGSLHADPNWSLRAEYLYSLPVFDSTSIYSVFAVSEYEELSGEAVVRLAPGLRLLARYAREMYEEFEDADVYELGVEKIRTARWSGYIFGTLRDDHDGQDLKGIKASASLQVLEKLSVGAGAHFDVLERDDAEDDDTTAKRYWIDGRYAFTNRIGCELKVERVESALWDYYNRGRVRVNVRF
jgi:hypothetical protein